VLPGGLDGIAIPYLNITTQVQEAIAIIRSVTAATQAAQA
jgi:hypothetical protein